jgi:hypothetical protein
VLCHTTEGEKELLERVVFTNDYIELALFTTFHSTTSQENLHF